MSIGFSIIPNLSRKSLITPKDGLNICAHIKPDTTIGTAHGNIAKDLNIVEPRVILDREWANIRLIINVREVTPMQKIRVFLKLSQNTRWWSKNL